MKRILILLSFCAVCMASLHAQVGTGKLTFGGGVGLQFGEYTLINLAPQVGYNVGNMLNVGAGFTYTYYSDKYDHDRYKQSNSYLGFNVYAKCYPTSYLVVMVQPEASRMWKTVKDRTANLKTTTDKFIPSCVVGAGLRMGPITAMLKYDLAQNTDSPYGTRIFYSVGYTFSF